MCVWVCFSVLCCALLCFVVLYCVLLYCVVFCFVVLFCCVFVLSFVFCCVVFCFVVLCCLVLLRCFGVFCCVVFCFVVLFCFVFCSVVLFCFVVFCCVVLCCMHLCLKVRHKNFAILINRCTGVQRNPHLTISIAWHKNVFLIVYRIKHQVFRLYLRKGTFSFRTSTLLKACMLRRCTRTMDELRVPLRLGYVDVRSIFIVLLNTIHYSFRRWLLPLVLESLKMTATVCANVV